MKIIYTLFFVLTLMNERAHAQQNFNTAGGSGTTANLKLDWSIGESTLVQTERKSNLVLTQGFLQPIIIITSSTDTIEDGELKLLPNPTPGMLYLQTGFLKKGKMSLLLFNSTGQEMVSKQEDITGFTTKRIDLSGYANGAYLLQVYWQAEDNTVRKRTYKIVKF